MKKTASCILLICGTLVMYLTGCGKSISQQEALSKSSEESYVTLKALTIGVPPEDGMDQYYEELDKKTEELGCHLKKICLIKKQNCFICYSRDIQQKNSCRKSVEIVDFIAQEMRFI